MSQSDVALFQTVLVLLANVAHSTLTEQVDFAPTKLHLRDDQCQLQRCRLSVAGRANNKKLKSQTQLRHISTLPSKISLRLNGTLSKIASIGLNNVKAGLVQNIWCQPECVCAAAAARSFIAPAAVGAPLETPFTFSLSAL